MSAGREKPGEGRKIKVEFAARSHNDKEHKKITKKKVPPLMSNLRSRFEASGVSVATGDPAKQYFPPRY